MSRGKEPRVSGAGIVANRAALVELGEWNYCLEERDSFLSCPQIRFVTFWDSLQPQEATFAAARHDVHHTCVRSHFSNTQNQLGREAFSSCGWATAHLERHRFIFCILWRLRPDLLENFELCLLARCTDTNWVWRSKQKNNIVSIHNDTAATRLHLSGANFCDWPCCVCISRSLLSQRTKYKEENI